MSEVREKKRSKAEQRKNVELLRKSVKGKRSRVSHIAELAEHLLTQWGSPEAFAIAFKAVYDGSSKMGQAGMLRDVCKLIEISSRGVSEANDLSTMSNAELLAAAKDLGLDLGEETKDSEEAAGHQEPDGSGSNSERSAPADVPDEGVAEGCPD